MDQVGTSVAPEVQDSLSATSFQFEIKTEPTLGRKRAYSESASSLVDRIPGKIRKMQFKKKPNICNCVKIEAKVTPGAEDIEQPKAEMNTPSSEEGDDDKEKEKKEILSMMECPVCLEHPREGPIFNCEHGHLVCGKCQPKIRECPICRSANVGHRNLFAEKMLSLTLKSITLPCTNHNEGCKVTGLAKELHKHESICMFRKIQCPAHHRGACHWQGSLTKLYPHLSEKKCAQVRKVTVFITQPLYHMTLSTIGAFSLENGAATF